MKKNDRSADSLERLFAALRTLHARSPDLRIGQMIYDAVWRHRGTSEPSIFFIENDDLTTAVMNFVESLDGKK